MYPTTPADTFMRRLRLLAAAMFLAFTWQAHAISISIDANLLKDVNGNAMTNTGLVLLVASTSDATFNAPTPINFVTGDDVIIAKWDLRSASGGGFDTNGVLSAFINTTVPVSASNPLRLYWYPTLNINSTAPGQNTPYGTYTDATGIDGSAKWYGDAANATITLRFLTSDADPYFDNAGSNPPAAGIASSVTPIAIAINTQPSSTTQILGATATFSVNASGTSLAYQWRKNGANLTDGGNVAGSTTANLTLSNLAVSDAASYSVVITNSQAAVTSSSATLTIDDLTIAAQPASFTANCGATWPCLSITASASSGVTYQWYTPDANGSPIPGATNASLCLNNTFASGGNYAVVVTSGYGNSIASSVATVTVTDTVAPNIALNGANPALVCQNTPYTELDATATDACDGSVAVTHSGTVDTSTLGNYTITYNATDSHGNVGVAYRTVKVQLCGPSIVAQPLSGTVDYGSSIDIFVVANPNTATFQWKFNGTPIFDATNNVFSKTNVTTADAGSYTVDVTAGTTVTSDPAIITVRDPAITNQPLAQIVTNGQKNVQLTIAAAGAGTLKYQWYKEGTGAILHKTNASLVFPTAGTANTGTYYCTVTGSSGTAESAHVGLSVYFAPKVSMSPPTLSKTAGNVAQFKATVTPSQAFNPSLNLGGPVTFQWLKNGAPISVGGNYSIANTMNTSVLTIQNVQDPDQATYQCTVANLGANATTPNTKGTLTVLHDSNVPVAAILHPSNGLRFTNGLPDYVGGGHFQSLSSPDLQLDGNANDNGYITNVALIRTVPPNSFAANLTLTYRTNAAGLILPGKVLWTNQVTLLPGTNTFIAVDTDSAGLTNINNTARTYYYFTNGTVTINVNSSALGSVTGTPTFGFKPVQGVNSLPVSMTYKLTAVHKPGKTFVKWTDGDGNTLGTLANSVLYFTATDGMIINANFQ